MNQKRTVVLGMALVGTISVSSAMAEGLDPLHALSQVPATERAALTAMADDQLASIEAGALVEVDIVIPVNVAVANQLNVCAVARCDQGNIANIAQIVRVRLR